MLWSMNIGVGTKYAYPLGSSLTLEGFQIYFGDRKSYILYALSWISWACVESICFALRASVVFFMKILVLKDLCLPSPGVCGPSVGNFGLGGKGKLRLPRNVLHRAWGCG